ncbi:hypothetical protein [Thermus thermamylovorans]|uniref:Uncharacterized protein n=1 Tax=Thermus thermamylovorans TaxID=2509362 RepID=A0A4Q9B5B6_9DEIN|nr:hypothetical protein [Thermus thermamylovorans]TBH21061.1 hypothetical protein ETP66_04620 [Thermus thermamylovorans]
MTRRGAGRLVPLFLYLLLTLTASTGVALQLYLMQAQNPGLRLDVCQNGEREVGHSLLCGLQVAPGLPVVEEPAAPTPLPAFGGRPASRPGHPAPTPSTTAPRAPPFAA